MSGQSPSYLLALISMVVYICFRVSANLHKELCPSSTPSYALVYRNFRQIVAKVPGLH